MNFDIEKDAKYIAKLKATIHSISKIESNFDHLVCAEKDYILVFLLTAAELIR